MAVIGYDTPERLSPSFRAKYYGRCPSCYAVFDIDDEVQYVGNKLGHPVIGSTLSFQGHRYIRACQRDSCPDLSYRETSVSVTDEIRRAEQQLAVLYARQEKMEAFGTDDDYSIGVVMSWKPDSGGYWQAAIKIGPNCWKSTTMGYTITFGRLVEDNLVPAKEVWWNSEMERLQ